MRQRDAEKRAAHRKIAADVMPEPLPRDAYKWMG
jgi:hypothetical protein